MVALKRKRTDAAQEPSKKLHIAEGDDGTTSSDPEESEDGQNDTNNEQRAGPSNKLPTVAELRAINEAASLYRSNIFKAQLDLLLPTVRPKTVQTQPLERCLEKLYRHLTSIQPISPLHPLETAAALSSLGRFKQSGKKRELKIAVPYPKPLPTQSTAWKVSFEPPDPKGIVVVGSWQDEMVVRKPDGAPFSVDVMVEMPESIFQEKDYRNLRLFHKRAFYLACLASSLIHSSDFGNVMDIQYESPEGDERRTAIILSPKTDAKDTLHPNTCIRILPTVPDTVPIPLSRLSPLQANLRFSSSSEGEEVFDSFPVYNATIALTISRASRTHLLNSHKLSTSVLAFRDAVALVRIWANQRGYGAGSLPNVNKNKYPMAEYCISGFEGLGSWWSCVVEILLNGEEVQDAKAKKGAGRPVVGKGLSSYQLFRATLEFLSKRDFVKEPAFMKVAPGGAKYGISEWVAASSAAASATSFQCDEPYLVPIPVFVDGTGCVNLLAGVPVESLELLRLDASATLSLLNNSQAKKDAFDKIFLRDLREPNARFDAVMKFDVSRLHTHPKSQDPSNPHAHVLTTLLHTLRRGLNTRIQAVVALLPRSQTRPVSSAHPTYHSEVTIGIISDPNKAGRLIDLGPQIKDSEEDVPALDKTNTQSLADTDIVSNPFPTLNAFKTFWGPKSELRRFKDGRIVDSCVWDDGVVRAEDREGIIVKIVEYILRYRFRTEHALKVTGKDLGDIVAVRDPQKQGSFKEAMKMFETLVKTIKALEDEDDPEVEGVKHLPLSVVSCRPGENAAGLRYMSMVPPIFISGGSTNGFGTTTEPFGVVLQLEKSGKWPDDLRAIQRVKMALLESMARGLRGMKALLGRDDLKMTADVVIEERSHIGCSAALEVALDGWSFRVRIAQDRECLLLEEIIKPSKQPAILRQEKDATQEMTPRQAEQALSTYQSRFKHAPAHHTAFLALHHRISAFGYTVRLVKRWFGAHWLSGRIREEVVELICAAVFLEEGCSIATGKKGFVKVLEWLADWEGVGYVGVFEAVQDESVSMFLGVKNAEVEIVAGPGKGSWRLVTKEDKEGTVWCSDVGPVIAARVRDLARASVEAIRNNFLGSFKPIFIHSREDYDFVIELDERVVTRRWQSVAESKATLSSSKKTLYVNLVSAEKNDNPYRIGFNPSEAYFRDLQYIYGDVAELFYDIYGGTFIGGVWNPAVAGREHSWKVMLGFTSIPHADTSSKDKGKVNVKATVLFNKDGVLAEMMRIGEGIATKITERQKTRSAVD